MVHEAARVVCHTEGNASNTTGCGKHVISSFRAFYISWHLPDYCLIVHALMLGVWFTMGIMATSENEIGSGKRFSWIEPSVGIQSTSLLISGCRANGIV